MSGKRYVCKDIPFNQHQYLVLVAIIIILPGDNNTKEMICNSQDSTEDDWPRLWTENWPHKNGYYC